MNGVFETDSGGPDPVDTRLLAQLLADLESSFEGMEGDKSTRRLQAAYAVFGSGLKERYLPVLQLTGLHEYYLDADHIKMMLDRSGCSIEPDMVNPCYHILENAGFCTHKSAKIFADTNESYSLMIAVRSYARLLNMTAGTERRQLRQAWSTCMPQELTKILEEMESKPNNADS